MKIFFFFTVFLCVFHDLQAQESVNVYGKYFTCGQTFRDDMLTWTGIPFSRTKFISLQDTTQVYQFLNDGEGIFWGRIPAGSYNYVCFSEKYEISGPYRTEIVKEGQKNTRVQKVKEEKAVVYKRKKHGIAGEVFVVQTESEWIPVADATVVCILPDGSQQKVKTDTKGRYMFSDLWEGRYRILIVAENYKEKEYEFSLQENLLINAALMPEGTIPEGFLYDYTDNASLAFAAVTYTNMADTSLHYYGMADFEGHYRMENLPDGVYSCRVTCVGYEPQVFRHNTRQANRLNLYVHRSNTSLEEVTVKGETVRYDIDRTVYNISRRKLAVATNTYDLFNSIPFLKVDRLNRNVSTLTGKSVLVLINGLSASQSEILALNPAQVARIEHYQMPPVRYANEGYGAVVNIITKGELQGGEVFALAEQAVNAGYGNYQMNAKYNHGRSSYSMYYSLNHRDYNKRKVSDALRYTLDHTSYEKIREGLNSPFFYNTHEGMMAYSHVKPEKHAFQVKLMPAYFTQRVTNRQKVTQVTEQPDTTIRVSGTGVQKMEGHYFTPSANVYYSKQMNDGKELIVDMTGTYYDAESKRSTDETGIGFREFSKVKNHKYTVIGEVLYGKRSDKFKWNVGVKHRQYYFSQETGSSLGELNYGMSSSDSYVYAELVGKINKWTYNLSAGMSYTHFSEAYSDREYDFWTVRPRIGIKREIGRGQLSMEYALSPVIPSLNQLGGGESMVDRNIVSMGNPSLKPYRIQEMNLTYQRESNGFMFLFQGVTQWINHQFANGFFQEGDKIYTTYRNDFDYLSYGIFGGFTWDVFNNGLIYLMAEGGPCRTESKQSGMRRQHWNDVQLDGQFVLNLGIAGLAVEYQKKQYEINGQYRFCKEHTTHVMLFSKGESWMASVVWYYPFTAWKTDSRTLTGYPVDYRSKNYIGDNKNMIVLNLSYRLPFGKKRTKDIERRVENADKDAGIIKY